MLLELIKQYQNIIQSWSVDQFETGGPHLRLKGRVFFIDGSVLFFRQVVLDESYFKYAYHWQDANGNIICRWDNAPHWPDIATYPHHKHFLLNGEVRVSESKGGDLELLFEEIAIKLRSYHF